MAIDVRPNLSQEPRSGSKLAQLLRHVTFWTRDALLIPRGFQSISLTVGQPIYLGSFIPAGTSDPHTIVVNVEGAAVRYCDSEPAGQGHGELYQVGASFARTLRNVRAVSLAAEAAGAIVNVSFYEVSQ